MPSKFDGGCTREPRKSNCTNVGLSIGRYESEYSGMAPVKVTVSKVPVMPDEVKMMYVPGTALGFKSISKVPANDALDVTATNELLLASISICTRLPRTLFIGSAGLRDKLPRVSVPVPSGAMVPELTKTVPVKVPVPLKVPLWVLTLMFLQTEIDASSISPFTLKFALLMMIPP